MKRATLRWIAVMLALALASTAARAQEKQISPQPNGTQTAVGEALPSSLAAFYPPAAKQPRRHVREERRPSGPDLG